jgi:lipopolysaccharide export system protein LptC|tara:strand:+ start:534 stop:1094 length:561 start_codon:yes stop_codon:yes gene_type:complete
VSRRVALLLLVLFGAVIILLWRPFQPSDGDDANVQTRKMTPDFTASGLKTRLYESGGRLAHQVTAEHMSHYIQIGLTELSNPVYSVYTDERQATWQVSAEQGTLYDDQTLILERNVEILALQPDTSIKRVNTEYLVIDIPAETMNTDYPVTISGPQIAVQGHGLNADLYAETMELKRHVKTVFNPR